MDGLVQTELCVTVSSLKCAANQRIDRRRTMSELNEQKTANEELTLGEKINKLIHDPFGSVIAGVILISASSGFVYFGINALGAVA